MGGTHTGVLRRAGLRATAARRAVMEALERIGAPCTHAELAEVPELAGLDPVTLYRTLAVLERAELVHRAQGLDGAWRYCPQPSDGAGCPGNHVHFLCEGCGAMRCLVDQPMPKVEVPEGYQVAQRQFVAVGRCAACGPAEVG